LPFAATLLAMSAADEDSDKLACPLDAGKYDAVHRAVLTGLLSHIGLKGEAGQYTGVRDTKFAIFPGSGLFRRRPQWVMAAELVETAKFYARTVARIRPEWIERLAWNLVTKSYSEPRWQASSAHVVADEKVSLYGLTLVAARPVHYGPIEPAISRQLFIHHALVEGEFHTSGAFFKHNAALRAEVEVLESKIRRRDLLVDAQARYAFYDQRLPEGIHNGPLFEKWRREAEAKNPRILFMILDDLMRHGADEVNSIRYPDVLRITGMEALKLPLEYHFDAASSLDGVTATVPLAALNQLPDAAFDWLVPGLLPEKIAALIRSLPKHLRVHFVPVADTADAALAALRAGPAPLADALAQFLGQRAGLAVAAADFDVQAVPEYLRMNFRILDAAGKPLATGRDLADLRRRLGVQVKAAFAAAPATPIARQGITNWDFGDLPERVPLKRGGLSVYGYPALVDRQAAVSIDVLESPEAAAIANRAGVRRLFMLQVRHELRDLERNLPDIAKMSLHYAPLGDTRQLKADLLTAAADHALYGDDDVSIPIRTRTQYLASAESGWRVLNTSMEQLVAGIAPALGAWHEVSRKLCGKYPPLMAPSLVDIQEQLNFLLPAHFLVHTPFRWLRHFGRFVKGMQIRLDKLTNAGLSRDQQALQQIAPLWSRYKQCQAANASVGKRQLELETYRWMLEELRISLFAQELKTSIPISVARLEKQWTMVMGKTW